MYNKKHQINAGEKGSVQGDVPFLKIDELPANAKPRKGNNRIVAYGEVTGHHHVLEAATMYDDDLGNLFALVEKPTRLLHHEHGAIVLEPGIYQFGLNGVQQVEYLGDEERRALD
jgi:hypothetical protein